jgi:hypothetical protein
MFITNHSETTERSFFVLKQAAGLFTYIQTQHKNRTFEAKTGAEGSGNYSVELKQVSLFQSVSGTTKLRDGSSHLVSFLLLTVLFSPQA